MNPKVMMELNYKKGKGKRTFIPLGMLFEEYHVGFFILEYSHFLHFDINDL